MHSGFLKIFIFFCWCIYSSAALCQVPKAHLEIKSLAAPIKERAALKKAVNAVTATVSPPSISYPTPQVYVINTAITTLAPVNAGGAVPATIYAEVSTYSQSYVVVTGVAVDLTGNVYVADWGTNQIIKVTPAGVKSVFAGSGGAGSTDGQGTAASFNTPDALITDAAGTVYVSDQANNLIRKITPGGLVSTLAGNTTPGFADGTGMAASFNNPRGLTLDAVGNLYVADQANNLIRKITPAGVVATYAGTVVGGSANGPRLSASFSTPTGVEIDAAGNLYISDSSNGAIRKINTAGEVTTFATGLVFPRELRIDGTGNIYVADQNTGTVKRISPAGVVSIVAGNGNGSGATFMASPIGLMLDGKGNLFVGTDGNVKKIVVSGYTIDKALPPGLVFDVKTGIITGTPSVLWPSTDYIITAYNGGGSSTTTLNITVQATPPLKQSIITLPPQIPSLDANNNYNPGGISTNNETPITYTSGNTAIAIPTANGLIHLVGPGVTTITANQTGNANYYPAQPVSQQLTVVEYLKVDMMPIATKTVCDGDFETETTTSNLTIPLVFTSSNPAVATVSSTGTVHIVSVGTTNITVAQNANPPLYVSATPVSKPFTVSMPILPSISISASYQSPCAGDAITFTASVQNGGATTAYQWLVNNVNAGTNSNKFISATLKNGDVVSCAVTNTDNSCVAGYSITSNPLTVDLVTPQTPSVSIAPSVNSVLQGTSITFTATVANSIGNINYQWFVNGVTAGDNNPTFSSNSFANMDVVTCTVTPVAACSTPANSLPVVVYVVQEVKAPNTFTPNGDGTNDVWNISGIASYPKCTVNIYNRYGAPVFQSRGYQKPWNGTINGKLLPAATYYYVIDLAFKSQRLSGYITILR